MANQIPRAQLLSERTDNLNTEEIIELTSLLNRYGVNSSMGIAENLVKRIDYLLWSQALSQQVLIELRDCREDLIKQQYF